MESDSMLFTRDVVTFTEAAKILNVDRRTVSDLVSVKNIKLHPLVPDGPDRALDRTGIEALKEALRPVCASA